MRKKPYLAHVLKGDQLVALCVRDNQHCWHILSATQPRQYLALGTHDTAQDALIAYISFVNPVANSRNGIPGIGR
ncbi:MAG: hypothetical protein Q8927_07515 [Bacteroidota bacterium]|nr:hypothetical protein [Bacteroidota bacterium]MDP4216035.1 hypothetical protein [Bacteroidota bacterium]MDP4246922.1 hypothetical protein [Bacteroidota bacterium]MDP4253489.1 hypothetical protein [Bacteroidota bacterium]MDP4260763.1 hypothetical protein [Bacteroidota bacterium]